MHEETIGRHTFSFEPPDLGRGVFHGDISADEMRRMVAYMHARAAEHAPLFFLADIAGLGAVPPETRREVRGTIGIPYGAIAGYRATFRTKILATMMLRIMKLISPSVQVPVGFFDTEAEARRWIDAQRAALGHSARKR